ncbi:hypothetical protein BT63DRAFT_427659 [Microthyrium microscopicum]|uniref:DNA/RNA-binding protein Kin17 WH-like domain-containing protein n=1 Tax=Microthyrium microscopicum TaxID=703497 RepID=A0A6A6U364_9PEZI|nr:hypothetical protein BT63DRAFT_427659 [Microthyrium microscopicum]
MPKAEVGSTKHLANKMKSKGLQRLRWWCEGCQRQMRDENGFKQHTLSEGHVRNMQLIGQDPKKFIRQYSNEFKRDFLSLLRTSHGEKPILLNRFYNEYIANKEHVHMNATQWNSLSEFAKFLSREGICRITDNEDGKGVYISWIDNSPEALRRQDAIRKKERQDKGDDEREKRAIEEQVQRARKNARLEEQRQADADTTLERKEGEKITLQFGSKAPTEEAAVAETKENLEVQESDTLLVASPVAATTEHVSTDSTVPTSSTTPATSSMKLSFGGTAPRPKNVFSAAKKNPLAARKGPVKEQPKKMSEAERIMREEMDRKRKADSQGGAPKRMKFNLA